MAENNGMSAEDVYAILMHKIKQGGGGGGNVDDVKVNGVSVVTNKIANIDLTKYQQYCMLNLTLNKSDGTAMGQTSVKIKNRMTGSVYGEYDYDGSPIIIPLPAGFDYTIICAQVVGISAPINKNITAISGQLNVTMTYLISGAVYGFHIDGTEDDPALKISYLRDAIGASPAFMDFDNDRFDWGSWLDAFFMPRPCMLKSNGVVDYYLDENDYTRKEDGVSSSDVSNIDYDGNAMMEWGRDGRIIWYKIVPDENDPTSADVFISDVKQDEGYHCWPFLDMNGNLMEHFYTPIYNGSYDSDTKLRSISGQTCGQGKSGQAELDAAHKNNVRTADMEWSTEQFCDIELINLLLMLIGKSTNTQDRFGYGHCTGGSSASNLLQTGTMNNKGLFWGKPESTTGVGVKIFGMENWWGNQWRRFEGLVTDGNKKQKYKLTYSQADGSTITGYNSTGSGYIESDLVLPSSNYIVKHKFDGSTMLVSNTSGGSATTYYCDYSHCAANCYAFRGGTCYYGLLCGAFTCYLNYAFSTTDWSVGAALSCKPIVIDRG